jgi:hypothetical protein
MEFSFALFEVDLQSNVHAYFLKRSTSTIIYCFGEKVAGVRVLWKKHPQIPGGHPDHSMLRELNILKSEEVNEILADAKLSIVSS